MTQRAHTDNRKAGETPESESASFYPKGMVAQAYVHADQVLRSAWENRLLSDASDEGRALKDLLWSRDVSTRYATVTQLLLKVAYPDIEATKVTNLDGVPFPSTRSLCKNVVVPFNDEVGQPLGDSADPYVSNPLRVDALSTEAAGDLGLLARLLEDMKEGSPDPEALLRGVMGELEYRVPFLRNWLLAGVSVQERWARDPEPNGAIRRRIIVDEGIEAVEDVIGEAYVVSGGAGQGTDAEIPWVAAFPTKQAASAQKRRVPGLSISRRRHWSISLVGHGYRGAFSRRDQGSRPGTKERSGVSTR